MKHLSLPICISVFALFYAHSSVAQAGTLDATFGTMGKARLHFGTYAVQALDLQPLPDGKILASGTAYWSSNFTKDSTFLTRITQNGRIDSTFGVNGLASSYGKTGYTFNRSKIKVQPDGKIVMMAAMAPSMFNIERIILIRYNPDGSFDTSFGQGGVVTTTSSFMHSGNDMILAPDGKIIVGGNILLTAANDFNFLIMRFLPNGATDPSFSDDGLLAFNDPGNDEVHTLALQPDGKILAMGLGQSVIGVTQNNVAIVRINDDGSLDASFGIGGKVNHFFAGINIYAESLLLLPDGKLIISGPASIENGTSLMVLSRFTTDGLADTDFGTDGLKICAQSGAVRSLALQSDSKILMGGTYETNFALARANTDGSFDNGFSNNGALTQGDNNQLAGLYLCWAVKVATDGKIISLAVESGPVPEYLVITRVNAEASSGTGDISSTEIPLAVYPNPVVDGATVVYTLPHASQVELALYDQQGRLVQSFYTGSSRGTGSHQEVIPVDPALPAGVYHLEIKTAYGTQMAHIIKKHL